MDVWSLICEPHMEAFPGQRKVIQGRDTMSIAFDSALSPEIFRAIFGYLRDKELLLIGQLSAIFRRRLMLECGHGDGPIILMREMGVNGVWRHCDGVDLSMCLRDVAAVTVCEDSTIQDPRMFLEIMACQRTYAEGTLSFLDVVRFSAEDRTEDSCFL